VARPNAADGEAEAEAIGKVADGGAGAAKDGGEGREGEGMVGLLDYWNIERG
jgi:hypothetical protein